MIYEIQYILHRQRHASVPKIERIEAASKFSAGVIIRQKNYSFDRRGKSIKRAEIINIEKV